VDGGKLKKTGTIKSIPPATAGASVNEKSPGISELISAKI